MPLYKSLDIQINRFQNVQPHEARDQEHSVKRNVYKSAALECWNEWSGRIVRDERGNYLRGRILREVSSVTSKLQRCSQCH